MFLSLFCATFVVFLVMQLSPSDPITIMLKTPAYIAKDTELLEKRISKTKEELGLNDNVGVQYVNWLNRLLHFDLGNSLLTGEKISDAILRTLPKSVILAFCSMLIQSMVAVLLAILSVLYYGKFLDQLIRAFCVFLQSVPFFAVAIVVLTYASTKFFIYDIQPDASMKRMILPALVVGITIAPRLVRNIRAYILDEIGKLYIQDAIAKGYDKYHILKYALRNSLLPITTVLAMSFATSIGGMVVTESIFSWKGIGEYSLAAVLKQDYFVVQAYILIIVGIVLLINFANDIMYIFFNPRVRRAMTYDAR